MRRASGLEILALTIVAGWLMLGPPAIAFAAERTLVMGIDSVPLDEVEKYIASSARRVSVLANLSKPAALVSTFPSTSYAAWSGILEPFEVDKPLGYYGKYYDREQSIVTGFTSDWLSLNRPVAQSPWFYFFDWRLEDLLDKARAYVQPGAASIREVRDSLEAFSNSSEEIFFAYIVSPDALAHANGPKDLAEFLHQLDLTLLEYADERGILPFRLVLLSDHGIEGGETLTNLWPAVEESLEGAGYQVSDAIESSEDVAIIRVGMVSSFEVYTADERKHEVAKLLGEVPGVRLCASKDNEIVNVFGAHGAGKIHRKQGAGEDVLFSYEWSDVDPLALASTISQMGGGATDDTQRWYSDSQWFDATLHTEFPDVLFRIYNGFDIARNPASLLCSLEPGYAFGAETLAWLSWLANGDFQWTHGALTKASSIGFIMTNGSGWQPVEAVRFNHALRFLREGYRPVDEPRSKPGANRTDDHAS